MNTYLGISIFGVAVIGLMYTIYAGAFYAHGDPLTPVLYGLKKNKTITDLSKFHDTKETTNIIYILDVSSSTQAGNVNNSWVDTVRHQLIPCFRMESVAAEFIPGENPTKPLTGLDLIKLKTGQFLKANRDLFDSDSNHLQFSTIISFGNYTDIDIAGEDIRDRQAFQNVLGTVFNLKPRVVQSSRTRFDGVLSKLIENDLLKDNGHNNGYQPQKNVIVIFSDFVHDAGSKADRRSLKALVDSIGQYSAFVNLCFLEGPTELDTAKHVKVINFFEQSIPKESLKITEFDKFATPSMSAYLAPQDIVFIIDKPFHVSEICNTISGLRGFDKVELIGPVSNGQVFELQGKRLYANKKINLTPADSDLGFTGHVPKQFSDFSIRFISTKRSSTTTLNVIFKTGLPPFVASIIAFLGLLLFFCTFVYLIILAFHLGTSLIEFISQKAYEDA